MLACMPWQSRQRRRANEVQRDGQESGPISLMASDRHYHPGGQSARARGSRRTIDGRHQRAIPIMGGHLRRSSGSHPKTIVDRVRLRESAWRGDCERYMRACRARTMCPLPLLFPFSMLRHALAAAWASRGEKAAAFAGVHRKPPHLKESWRLLRRARSIRAKIFAVRRQGDPPKRTCKRL